MIYYGMGIDGAACATIFSQFVYAAVMLWYFKARSKNVRIHGVRIEKSLVSEFRNLTNKN